MSDEMLRPAWSQQFTPEAIQELLAYGPFARITPEWAWGGSTGRGIRVAVVDSGIEYDHPALGESVRSGVIVEYDAKSENEFRYKPYPKPADVSGHGTACAGIIHSIAPEAELLGNTSFPSGRSESQRTGDQQKARAGLLYREGANAHRESSVVLSFYSSTLKVVSVGFCYKPNQVATFGANAANKIIPPSMKKATFGL